MELFKEILGIQSNAEAVYWILALTSTFLFLLKLILSIFGGVADSDIDMTDDADFTEDGDLDNDSVFSSNTILAFFKGAGWIGVICYRFTKFQFTSIIIIAFFSGIITFIFALYLLRYMKTLESSGTLDYKNAISNVGTVYLNIPGKRKGVGQIQVEIQGRLTTVDAMTDKETLHTGEKVLVCYKDKKSDKLVVVAYNDETDLI
jgi:hypothetical protein